MARTHPNRSKVAARADVLVIAKTNIEFLDRMANVLDGWADESRQGGWSTHQVKANKSSADECRRHASQMRAALAAATGAT